MTSLTSTPCKNLKYLTLSDIHFGHGKTLASFIIANLTAYFDDFSVKSKFIDLDIIFIAGDMLDKLLTLADDTIHDIILFLSRLIDFCAKHGIKLRVLEGTPSHDRNQSRLLETVYAICNKQCDCKYIKSLSIEIMEDLGLSVLYVPDEWRSDPEVTYQEVLQLMEENHLHKVDIAIMHGCFHYQMKNIPGKHPCHDEHKYLALVRYYINIGHIHIFSVYERILAQGSADRLAHGEEKPKGGIVCRINTDGTSSFEFIENTRAKKYVTLNVDKYDLDEAIAYIGKKTKALPDDSHVRIVAAKSHPVFMGFDQLHSKFPGLNLTKKDSQDPDLVEIPASNLFKAVDGYNPITISADNVVHLLLAEMEKYALPPDSLGKLTEILTEEL